MLMRRALNPPPGDQPRGRRVPTREETQRTKGSREEPLLHPTVGQKLDIECRGEAG